MTYREQIPVQREIHASQSNPLLMAEALGKEITDIVFATAAKIDNRLIEIETKPGVAHAYEAQRTVIDMYSPDRRETGLPEFYATLRPREIFTSPLIYSVSSLHALENFPVGEQGNEFDDILLWPPIDHDWARIQTHRGLGLRTFTGFMRGLGMSLGRKDECLWFGSQIDGEQFNIEDSIARSGPGIDEAIVTTFFDVPDVATFLRTDVSLLRIHPKLAEVVRRITHNDTTRDHDSSQYIDLLLDTMYTTMGTREGWFTIVEKLLKYGEMSQLPEKFSLEMFERYFTRTAKKGVPITKASQAIILEVNPDILFTYIPLYIFPLSTRPPESIIPVPLLPTEAVTGIYLEGIPDMVPERFRSVVRPLGAIATSAWLTDSNGAHITPQQAKNVSVDRTAPLCVLRYNADPAEIWAKHLAAGNIAPWSEGADSIRKPNVVVRQALRHMILTKARASGLVEQYMEFTTNDEQAAEERIMVAAMKKVALYPVQYMRRLNGAFDASYYDEPDYARA
jgi:hypothetical protein